MWESKEQNNFLNTLHNISFKKAGVAHIYVTEIIFSFPFWAEKNLRIDTMNQMFQYNLKVLLSVSLACIVMHGSSGMLMLLWVCWMCVNMQLFSNTLTVTT